MAERGEWIKIDDAVSEIAEESWSLYWGEAKSESEYFERLLREPLDVLVEEIDGIDREWHVISTVINHQFKIDRSLVCRVLMVMPEIKTAQITYYKHPAEA
jgi:hypothetical protein